MDNDLLTRWLAADAPTRELIEELQSARDEVREGDMDYCELDELRTEVRELREQIEDLEAALEKALEP